MATRISAQSAEAAVLYARAAEHAAKVQDRAPKSSEIAAVAHGSRTMPGRHDASHWLMGPSRTWRGKGLRSGLDSVSIQESASAGGIEAQYLLVILISTSLRYWAKGKQGTHHADSSQDDPIMINPMFWMWLVMRSSTQT